jgi:putative acetyltransferase
VIVRLERPDDRTALIEIERAAFGTSEESVIVERVRDEPGSFALVAETATEIVGHVQMSVARIGDADMLSLGPIAVAPAFQRGGSGPP